MKSAHTCPVCNTPSPEPYLNVKDHTVSQETFSLLQCSNCGFILTSPIPSDLARYYQSTAYISHTDKATGLIDILYKFARTQTLRWKTNLINRYNQLPVKTLLDYGCGTGAFLNHAQNKGWHVSGVEPASAPRSAASKATNKTIAADLQELPDQTYSVITLWHVLEHIEALHETLNTLRYRLSENGTIFIAVPNHNSHDANYYREHWAAYDTPRHLWHFSRSNMDQLLKSHQLRIQTIVPMKLDALYVSILSEKYRAGSGIHPFTALIKGITEGLRSNLSAGNTNEYSSLIYIARK